MTIKKFLLSIGIVLVSVALKAQDVHFSYFEMSPLTFNPAQTGAFSGTIRVSGHYRGQWFDVDGYKTPAFSLDSPAIKGFRKYDWVGGGISFVSDNAGAANLKTTISGLNLAYHFGMDKNYSRVFSVGLRYGSYARKLDNSIATTIRGTDTAGLPNAILEFGDTGYSNSSIAQILPSGENIDNNSKSDYGIGFLYKAIPDKTSQFELGFAIDHVTFPRTSFLQGAGGSDSRPDNCTPDDLREECMTGIGTPGTPGIPGQGIREDQDRRNITYRATSNYTRYLNSKVRFSPGAMVQFTKQGFEAQFHAIAGYLMDPKKGIVVNGGLGFRAIGAADAQLFFGMEMKDLKVGAAFDLGLIGFQQANGFQNAFELGATYIIKIYKDPEVDPVIFCPRF